MIHWALLATCMAAGIVPAAAPPPPERPNVLFILIDDLGWKDLGCQGNARIRTPAIDRLASQGMRFTCAYASAPVCSPTRAAILTGRSPARLHLTNHIPDRFVPKDASLLPAETLDHLPPEETTFAERLKEAGYATAFLGKWHLAGPGAGREGRGTEAFYPERQGFDLNFGGCALGGPPTYFDPFRIHNLESRRPGEYLPDRLADEAVAFLRAHRDGPFLLCLWTYTVHWPMEAKPDLLARYAGREGPGLKDARYGAKVEGMDAAIGRVLAALDELEIAERTLVIFTSDNGGFLGVADNRPLRLGKGYLYEGGIRVPLIVRWPGVVRPGSICRVPVISTDFFPTILAAAGLAPAPTPPLDGESLMPLLRQSGTLGRDAVFFHYPNYAWHLDNRLGGAVREGDFKLIETYEDGSIELYDLGEDIGETRDLSKEMPERARALRQKLDAWLRASGARMPVRRPAP
ncbi:MAG: sulfatase [Planctomycetes bacterium]|nr:sulfatase [Planctomycetota bacterium]